MLHRCLKDAEAAHVIARNPTDGAVVPKASYKPKQILTKEQMETFLAAVERNEIWRDFFYTELTTGLLFLGPATVCLAVTIYAQIDLLKKNLLPILAGCAAGAVTSVLSIWGLCRLFGLDRTLTVSLLPKSVTTPIATAIAEGQGGIVSITVAAVIFTGILGNLCAPALARLFRVKDPVAAGLAIGACSHAMGTARALELGETEGAMSGLAIGLCGLATTILALFFDVLV